jgi:integrase
MIKKAGFASSLGSVISRYLALKETLGRGYVKERAILTHLDAHLAASRSELTPDAFTSWCHTGEHLASGGRRNRMRIVRNPLCLYRRRTGPTCFVPDSSQFPPLHQPLQPYIFTENEIARLVRAADRLTPLPRTPLRREVFRSAIVLLYTTGLRRGELLGLTVGDYDPHEQVLLVRASKFHKSRLLPLGSDGTQELNAYLEARSGHRLPTSSETPLISSLYRGESAYSGVGFGRVMKRLLLDIEIRTPAGRLPRIHDIRHTFTVHALLRWYRAGVDVQAKLPFLAAYMGHVDIISTQYYLQFVEDLAAAASERFARRCAALVTAPTDLPGGA